MRYFLFYLVILVTNIIQGITGFAGTILAMPFSMKLVGMETAVPVLNLLGLFSGVYVLIGNFRYIDRKELLKAAGIMECFVLIGLWVRHLLSGKPQVLYFILGIIVLLMAIGGLAGIFREKEKDAQNRAQEPDDVRTGRWKTALDCLILAASGLVHGMFVCGGPLLIGYLAGKIQDKRSFRTTISTVWIILNGTIFISQLVSGM